MKTLSIALVAATLVAGVAPALADDSNDSPTYKDQMTNLWIATKDPAYARLAGLTDAQIAAQSRLPVEHQSAN